MGSNHPLESLAAFAIVLAVGVMATLGFTRYIAQLKQDASRTPRST